MLEKIKKIIMEQFDVNESEINENTRIVEDLGADSLDIVELISDIQDEFSVNIPKEKIKKIHTVKDIIKYIDKE